jgi:hypothetical protein
MSIPNPGMMALHCYEILRSPDWLPSGCGSGRNRPTDDGELDVKIKGEQCSFLCLRVFELLTNTALDVDRKTLASGRGE